MVSKFLTNGGHGLIRWSGSMPGVRICQFELEESWAEKMRAIPLAGRLAILRWFSVRAGVPSPNACMPLRQGGGGERLFALRSVRVPLFQNQRRVERIRHDRLLPARKDT